MASKILPTSNLRLSMQEQHLIHYNVIKFSSDLNALLGCKIMNLFDTRRRTFHVNKTLFALSFKISGKLL